MSDSSFSTGQPVYPTEVGDSAPVAPEVQIPPPVSTAIEIDGKTYTPDDLKEALRGQMRQSDYTRKTQDVAAERRALEAERQALAAERERLSRSVSRETKPDYLDQLEEEHPVLGATMRQIAEDAKEAKQYGKELATEREARRAEARYESEMNAVLDQMQSQNRPFFNRDEVRNYMAENGLGPNQAHVAYHALNSGRIAAKLAEQAAVSRGATAPAGMGAGTSRVSPTFTGASDAPGIDYSNLSFEQLKRLALNDPTIR